MAVGTVRCWREDAYQSRASRGRFGDAPFVVQEHRRDPGSEVLVKRDEVRWLPAQPLGIRIDKILNEPASVESVDEGGEQVLV